MKLSIQHLGKTYQDGKEALRDFNLDLDYGVYGLLGPNGAGKSTLLEILSLNLIPTTGVVRWEGEDIQKDPRAFRRVMGYLPQTYGFYGELTAQQMLAYLGKLHGLYGRKLRQRIEESLEIVNLTEVRSRKVKAYSGGMRQRLAIAQALLHSPEFLVIDEPTTGLDPGERVAFRNMLFDLGQNCVVLLSTHIVKDVEFSCHLMTLLFGGTQRFTGLPVDFMVSVAGRVFQLEIPLGEFAEFSKYHQVVAIHELRETIEVRFISPTPDTDVPGAESVPSNLEDAYVDFIRAQGGKEIVVVEAD